MSSMSRARKQKYHCLFSIPSTAKRPAVDSLCKGAMSAQLFKRQMHRQRKANAHMLLQNAFSATEGAEDRTGDHILWRFSA